MFDKLMEVIAHFDNALIAMATKVSHRIQRETGKNSCFQARVLTTLIILLSIAREVKRIQDFLNDPTHHQGYLLFGISITITTIGIAIYFFISLGLEKEEETVLQRTRAQSRLVNAFRSLSTRIAWLAVMLMSITDRDRIQEMNSLVRCISAIEPVCVYIFLYLIMVNPLPPCKGRIWEALKNLKGGTERKLAVEEG